MFNVEILYCGEVETTLLIACDDTKENLDRFEADWRRICTDLYQETDDDYGIQDAVERLLERGWRFVYPVLTTLTVDIDDYDLPNKTERNEP